MNPSDLLCPVMGGGCVGEKCAWWIVTPVDDEGCAVVGIAGSLYGLARRK